MSFLPTVSAPVFFSVHTRVPTRRAWAWAGVLLLAAGCASSIPTTPAPISLAGRYPLVSAAAQALPAVIADHQVGDFRFTVEAVGGELVVNDDGTYEHVVKRRGFANNVPLLTGHWVDRGRWSVAGAAFHMTSDLYQHHTVSGTVEGSTVTLTQNLSGDPDVVPAVTFDYRR